MKDEKIVVGLTGGIASGKSLAAEMFREAGAYIIDTDVVSRAVSESAEGTSALRSAFPSAFAGGKLDRRKLREEVFGNSDKRKLLDSIMHPLIKRETEKAIRDSDAKIVIVVAPLLFEAGFDSLVSAVISVSCENSVRIDRLVKRDDIGESLAREMVASQLGEAERNARADTVIYNGGSKAELRAQVLRVWLELSEKV